MQPNHLDILYDLLIVYGGTMAITAAVLLIAITCGFTRNRDEH